MNQVLPGATLGPSASCKKKSMLFWSPSKLLLINRALWRWVHVKVSQARSLPTGWLGVGSVPGCLPHQHSLPRLCLCASHADIRVRFSLVAGLSTTSQGPILLPVSLTLSCQSLASRFPKSFPTQVLGSLMKPSKYKENNWYCQWVKLKSLLVFSWVLVFIRSSGSSVIENQALFWIYLLFNATELHLQWWRKVYREKEPYLMDIEIQFHRHSWNGFSNNITLHLTNLFA